MTVYIYGLYCPIANTIRYVGKSTNPKNRLRAHISNAVNNKTNHHTARWLRKLSSLGHRPELKILHTVSGGECWRDVERKFIASAHAEGWLLTNTTAGGEGLDYINPADKDLYIQNLSAAMKKLWSTPERREENRARSIALHSDNETSSRKRAAIKEAYKSPELRGRISENSRRSGARPEVKEKKSTAMKLIWSNPDYRSVIESHRSSRAFVESQSINLRSRWEDESSRSILIESRWGEEQREAQRQTLAKRSDKIAAALTPEVIKKRNAAIKLSWQRRKQEAAEVA